MQAIKPLWEQMPLQIGSANIPRWVRNREDVSFREVYESVLAQAVQDNPITGIFQSAIDSVKETDAQRVQTEYLLATGQLDNPAEAMIATTKAQLAVTLLVQLRNRATEAYNELSRMNV